MIRTIVLIAILLALAGCSTKKQVEIQRVNVPIPIACQEQMPPRPIMPTDQLVAPVPLDDFARAAMAEIERREGYEVVLRTALVACTSAINTPNATDTQTN